MIAQAAPLVQPYPVHTFTDDFRCQEKFIEEIAANVGRALLRPAPMHLDRNKNVDLVLRFGAFGGVSCRVRRFPYLAKYPNEITIRASRPSGVATEINKIDACPTTHSFYGFANEREDGIEAWSLLDLGRLRDWWRTYRRRYGCDPGEMKENRDGTGFVVIDLNQLPQGVVIHRETGEERERWAQ